MKYWLIELIHNVDIMCNILFFMLNLLIIIAYAKSNSAALVIGKNLRRLWFACLAGVLLIPSQEVLHKLF